MIVAMHQWHPIIREIVGDQCASVLIMRRIGYLNSAGQAHATKPDLNISVSGKEALFGDFRVRR